MTTSNRPGLAVLAGIRTPFARSFGATLGATATDLARAVMGEIVARSGIDPGRLDEVILGCAGQPVDAMNIGRVAALRAGIPQHVPGVTVHRNCASGIEAVGSALRRVRALEAELMLVAGAESMTDAPFQIRRSGAQKLVCAGRQKSLAGRLREFARLRPADLLPRNTLRPALTDPVSGLLMGDTGEVLAREYDISRQQQDAYAAESQRRAVRARDAGVFREESMPFLVPPRMTRMIEVDDGIREDATVERLARLKPVFDRRFGPITVGNACQVTDGAAAMLVASESVLENMDKADKLGGSALPVLGRIEEVVTVGCDPRRMGLGPAIAIPRLLERSGLKISDIDLFEINEAFAIQVLACLQVMRAAAPPADVLNVNGGAIALGHPVGATGVRIILTLLLEMRRRNVRRGIASLCVGGGQGAAVLLENPKAR